jgi:uncharacterized protein (DUF697 family)
MASLFKLPEVWRVLREVDLEAIRRDAQSRFRIVVVSDDAVDGHRLATLLAGEEGHPWIDVVLAGSGVPEPSTATLALLLSREPELSESVAAAGRALRTSGVPVLSVVHGSQRKTDAIARADEAARVVVDDLDDDAVPEIADALADLVPPPFRLALARTLPPLREAIFDQLIDETARANATYSFTAAMAESVPVVGVPLNLADIIILTKNQLVMGYKIAVGAGKRGRAQDVIGEVLGVVGGGFLARQAARGLVGLIPIAGIIPKVAIAYTGTWAIGQAVVAWATHGKRVSPSTMRRLSRDARAQGRAFARRLVDARRSRSAVVSPHPGA